MAFPGAAAYSLLVLTNLVYNSFGGDGGGMQFFYASPIQFRHILLGKNLTHAGVLLFNAAFAWIAVTYLYGAPHIAVTVATLAGLLFAAPLNFAAGNLLSLYSPKKRDRRPGHRDICSRTLLQRSMDRSVIVSCPRSDFDPCLSRDPSPLGQDRCRTQGNAVGGTVSCVSAALSELFAVDDQGNRSRFCAPKSLNVH
jgi:hypothetical protein